MADISMVGPTPTVYSNTQNHSNVSNICSPPWWRRGSGLDFGSGDPGSIPCIPSPRVGLLMERR